MSITSNVFTDYFEWFLHSIADFLASEPIIYIFYLCLFALVINCFKQLISIKF